MIDQVSIYQRHQRIPCTESIPKGESGVLDPSYWQLTYLHVVATIFTINIVHDIGYNHSVIHSSIKVLLVGFTTTLHSNSR